MCTIFGLSSNKGFLLAKNNDTFFEKGILFINKRGIVKQALMMPPAVPAGWVSRYGSVSFSQCGRELPVGGMNEAGLVVEQATLPGTIYPEYSGKKGVGELQIIQMMLDVCSSVEEAAALLEEVEICQATWTLHYVLADASGDMAIVEYINGQKRIYRNTSLSVKVLANSRYDRSVEIFYGKTKLSEAGDEYEQNSIERFITAAIALAALKEITAEAAFDVLYSVRRHDTVWSIVYNSSEREVSFRAKGKTSEGRVKLGKLDFNRKSPSLYLSVSGTAEGDLSTAFEKYNSEINRELVYSFFKNDALAAVMSFNLPEELLDYISQYPEMLEAAG